MSRLEELPADQRAVLSLLLRRQKTYAEVAGMLAIPEQAVHDRAHAALAMLAPSEARGLDAERRLEVGDYLLGQQADVGERLRTRTLLAASPPANAWAGAIAAELAGIDKDVLPEIPPLTAAAGGRAQETEPPAQPAAAASVSPSYALPSSRRGGAILLAVLAVAVAVAVILIVSGGSSKKKTGSGSASTTASSKSKAGPREEGRITLQAAPGSTSKGTVVILAEGTKRAFYIQAEHLPSTNHFFYAVWLYNSPSSALALSKSPPVGKDHRLAGAALLPGNAGSYREILLTRETSTRPQHPGQVVLRGKLSPTA
jgi:sigma-70-like protein